MSLKVYKIYGIIYLLFALIGWIGAFIIMASYTYGLFEFTKEVLWGFIILFSSFPLATAIYDYFFFNMFIGKIQKNISNFSKSQNYCYSCGTEISDSKTLKKCPECNANLEFLDFLLKISWQ
ncbi:hypothetical protein ES705_27661 [subsurface metagenome]